MPLSELPTELDNRILTYLEHDALNAISKVSKYYRGIAEPFLYQHLKFDNQNETSIRWLFLTLVGRPDVAKHVKTFKISDQNEGRVQVKQEKLYASMWKALPKIQTALDNLLSPANPMIWQAEWIGALTGREGLQGCLAFILCHTINVESIDLKCSSTQFRGSFFFEILCVVCKKWVMERKLFFPKLHDLRTYFIAVPILPFFSELQTLTIEGDLNTLSSCVSSASAMSKIRTLTLIYTRITAASLCQLLAQQQLCELKTLCLFEAFGNDTQDLYLVLQSLRDQCPKLESLECFNKWCDLITTDMPVRGFQELHSLKILRIDMEMLLENNGASGLPHPATALPPNLEVLHLSAIPRAEFMDIVSPYLNNTPGRQAAIRYMNCLVSEIPLRDISISIMERFEDDDEDLTPVQLSPDMKKFLNDIACNFLAMGVKFSVGKLSGSHDDGPLDLELLVDAEFITDT